MKWAKKAYILYVSRHGGRETAERGIPVRAGLGAGAPLQGRNWGQGWGEVWQHSSVTWRN